MCSRAEIDRYLLDGLPPGREVRLRAHLRACPACRVRYDELTRVLRGLAGAPQGPTAGEEARLERLVLARAGLRPLAPPATRARSSPLEGLVWLTGGRLAALAAAGLALVLGLVWLGMGARGKTLEGMQELHLARGGVLRVFPGARARLLGEERLELEAGAVWCQVDRGRGEFTVRTPHAEVRVLGTSFVVEERAGQGTEVRVLSGQVELSARRSPGQVRLTAGERSAVLPGRPPAAPGRYDPRPDRAAWEQIQGGVEHALERADEIFRGVEKEVRDHLPR